jgi:hypothetical protein
MTISKTLWPWYVNIIIDILDIIQWAPVAQSVIATGYGLNELRGRSSRHGMVKNINFFVSSRPALEINQPRIQWVPVALSPGMKLQGRDADPSPPTTA